MKEPLILITGIHRSGTTWMGNMIAQSNKIHYIDEAFTPSRKHLNNPIDKWYLDLDYVCKEKQSEIKKYLLNQASSARYNFMNYFINFNKYNLATYIYNIPNNLKNQLSLLKRPLFKDPIALFSAGWFYKEFNAKVIIMIRHPAAFISSVMSKKWSAPFFDIYTQKELVENKLNKFKNEISEYAKNEKSLIEQNILIWNIIHDRINKYQKEYPEWIFIKHEDLIQNPISQFEKIYKLLNIEFNKYVKEKIEANVLNNYSASDLTRKSKLDHKAWESYFSLDSVDIIKKKTSPIWQEFYSESDW